MLVGILYAFFFTVGFVPSDHDFPDIRKQFSALNGKLAENGKTDSVTITRFFIRGMIQGQFRLPIGDDGH